jgi:tRNA A-37 threonylcarbamoyl transferase component Bud32
VAREMERRGLIVPPVVHVAKRGWGLGREELIVTRELPCVSVRTALAGRDATEARGVMELLGRSVAELHAAGVVHGHLLLGHLFLAAEGSAVIFIDNDENSLYAGPAPPAGRLMNLRQIAGQTLRGYGSQWRLFFHSYLQASGLGRGQGRRLLVRALRGARGHAQPLGRRHGRSRSKTRRPAPSPTAPA